MSLWSRIANAFRPDRLRRDIDEEFDSHIAEAVAQGRDPKEARYNFGNTLRQREESRDTRVVRWLDSLRADTIFGWRQLMKKKTSTVAAVLSLALAIGACTSAFRIIDALLLRPLPIADPDRLHVVVFQNTGMDGLNSTYDSCTYPMFLRSREAVKQQAELIGVSYADRTDLTFGSDQDMERAHIQYVSGAMFPAFGLRAAAGRLLTESDDVTIGAHPYAVLSYDYWFRRFGRDPQIIGRNLRLGDTLFQIIGIAPEEFTGTETGIVTDVFIPMTMKNPTTLASSDNFWLRTFVKLRPALPNRKSATPEAVYDRLRATWRSIQQERLAGFTNMSPRERDHFLQEKILLESAASGRSNMQRDYKRALGALAILVALVLLVACANLANLLTARAASRGREMVLRVSIGAGRWRLIQLVLVESAWLALLSTTLGALFAWRVAPLVISMISPADDPVRLELNSDWRTLGFGLALAIVVTFLFGLIPALRASAVRPASALKGGEDPHSRRRLMHVLIGLQVAFCFLVLFVAGLFTNTFQRLSNQPTGFSSEGVLNLETTTRTPQPWAYWTEITGRLRAIPGVDKVAIAGWPLMSGEASNIKISIGGAPAGDVLSDMLYVSPGFAEAMKIPLLNGRDFLPSDFNPSVAVVNQLFAKQFFGGADPTGKWFERPGPAGSRIRLQIIGLIPDARSRDNFRRPIRPTIWVPFQSVNAQNVPQPKNRGTFVVRTSLKDPLSLASVLRAEVARTRPDFHVANIRTQSEIVRSNTLRERLLATLALFFAVVALLLAGVGLYGVLDYSVLQRRREIGIRIAIGAKSADIARGVTSDVALSLITGALAGIALGIAGARYAESLLFDIKVTDPRMLVYAAAGIFAVALLASIRPVIRAVRIDPASMLRAD